jgi:excisionase family DNA binding protein
MDKLYTIQEVATKLNISDKTLRRWEEAGRFLSSRTLGNQRRYSVEDLQILDAIKHGTINEQKDLLTIEQAGKLCGVSPTTILRWEEGGKIHPFITSGNTYYPRQKLVEKMEELKKIYVEPDPVPAVDPKGSAQPADSKAGGSDPKGDHEPKLTPLTTRESHVSPLQFNVYLTNALVTLVLILSYHLLFNQTSTPISPQGSVQGASTIATPDPRLDDLIAKYQDHIQVEMLKDAKPISTSTTKADNASLISGSSTLTKNTNQISVTADKITATTPVTVTFTSDYAPAKKYWVTPESESFTLITDFPVSSDSTFNYSYIVPTSTVSATPVATATPSVPRIGSPSAALR